MKKRTVSSWKAKMNAAAAAGNPQAKKAKRALEKPSRTAATTKREIDARIAVQKLAIEALEAKRERDPLAELERILNEP